MLGTSPSTSPTNSQYQSFYMYSHFSTCARDSPSTSPTNSKYQSFYSHFSTAPGIHHQLPPTNSQHPSFYSHFSTSPGIHHQLPPTNSRVSTLTFHLHLPSNVFSSVVCRNPKPAYMHEYLLSFIHPKYTSAMQARGHVEFVHQLFHRRYTLRNMDLQNHNACKRNKEILRLRERIMNSHGQPA